MIPLSVPAEITSAKFRPRSMMIAPVIHISRCSTARPSECMWAILVELFQVSLKFGLECFLQVIALVKEACTEADTFLLAHPSDQLQLTFVFHAILHLRCLSYQSPQSFLCAGQSFCWQSTPQETYVDNQDTPVWKIDAYYNTRSLCTLNICVVSRQVWFDLCHRFCSGGGLS